MINLILDIGDAKTSLFMLTLVFTGRLKSVNLEQIDISKEHLKALLKIQTLTILQAVQIDETSSDLSMIELGSN